MSRMASTGSINRRTLATLVLMLWVGALGWLVIRHYGTGPGDEVSRWPVPPGSAFQAIRLGDRQVGLKTFTVDTMEAGLRVSELVTLDMPPANLGPRRTSIMTQQFYSRGLQLQGFLVSLLTESGREQRAGEVEGDSLLVVVATPESTLAETLKIRLRRPVVLPGAVPLVIASRGLPKIGDRLTAEVFDPVNMVMNLERYTIAAESVFVVPDSAVFNQNLKRWSVVHTDTVRAWRIDNLSDGLPGSRWIDAAGMPVRNRYPLGVVADRSAFEIVQANFRALPAPRWDRRPNAPQYLQDSSDASVRKHLTVVARLGLPSEEIPVGIGPLEGGWQVRTGDTIRVGPRGAEEPLDSTPDRKSEPIWTLYQPDSSLRDVVAKASGRDSRPEAVAAALNAWVNKNVAVRKGPGMRSPAWSLKNREGNEMERVLLLLTLARTAGLEARPVWGLVLIKDKWELRSWAEIWTDQWTPFDPTIGRGQDAGRVRLATGGVGRLIDLAVRAGRIRLDVVEAKQ